MVAVFAAAWALGAADAQARTQTSRAHITLSVPHAYQVFQRAASGRGSVVVRGRAAGFVGPVQVRWGAGPWRTARRWPDGSFSARLSRQSPGQATLVVRSARVHAVRVARPRVGVGDIYVIAGQSNASGRSSARFGCRHATLHAALFGNDDYWRRLADPVDTSVGQRDKVSRDPRAGGSVWPLVAEELMTVEGVPVAFVPCARGASDLGRWARPPRLTRRTLYGSMIRRVRAVGGAVRAVLLWQGEADARDPEAAVAYGERLRRLGRDVERDLDAPLVVAQLGDYGPAFTGDGFDVVRRGQAEAWGDAGIVAGPALYDIDLGGVVHFDAADDMAAAAHRWAAAILSGVLGDGAGRSPRLVSAELAAGGREVVLRADGEILPAYGLAGFIVREAGVQVPVLSAVSAPGGEVRLELVAAATGPVTVSLGEGRTAAGAAVPTDASAWRLPMLPFLRCPVSASGNQSVAR